jgi:hypothetical protein
MGAEKQKVVRARVERSLLMFPDTINGGETYTSIKRSSFPKLDGERLSDVGAVPLC